MTLLESSIPTLLLLSGGVDSAALAKLKRPALTVFVDYGQRPSVAERRAASAVSSALKIEHLAVTLDMRDIGGGLLLDDTPLPSAPSPEWWPFRNQFLATAGAAIAVTRGIEMVMLASVASDGKRHVDGRADFYEALNAVTSMQEGGVSISAPAAGLTTSELVRASGLQLDVLGWTVSCHRSNFPCHDCPGCSKRQQVFEELRLSS